MDSWIATALILVLALRVGLWTVRVSPMLRQRIQPTVMRWGALLDIAGGTLMIIIVGALLAQRAWGFALVFGALTVPSVAGLITGFRTLARIGAKDKR